MIECGPETYAEADGTLKRGGALPAELQFLFYIIRNILRCHGVSIGSIPSYVSYVRFFF